MAAPDAGCPIHNIWLCDSYYFPDSSIPSVAELNGNNSLGDSLTIKEQPGIAVNLWSSEPIEFKDVTSFCNVIGAPNEAFEFCLGDSPVLQNGPHQHLVAGSYVHDKC